MKKLLIGILCASLLLCLLPVTALAHSYGGNDYDDNDYGKLVSFLNQESQTAGVTNGQKLNAAYDPLDPGTWTGVTWISDMGVNHVVNINFGNRELAGSLDLSGFTSLLSVDAHNNAVTSLNLSGDNVLEYVDISSNPITALSLTGCGSLEVLYLSASGLTSLDVSGFASLEYIGFGGSDSLSSLNLSGCTALTTASGLGCDVLDMLNLTGCSSLEDLWVDDCNLSALDLSACGGTLVNLQCARNSLTSLNLSGFSQLEYADCSANGMTSLSIGGCTNLIEFYCRENALTSLDASALTSLEYLYCYGNSLTSLSVAGCTNLGYLYCNNNSLTSLDVSGNTLLQGLNCVGNELTSLDLSANTGIRYVDAFDNKLTHILASISGSSVELTAGPGGYVGLSYDSDRQYYAIASPSISFLNWTNASDEEVSTMVQTDLTRGVSYDLTANFLYITGDPVNGQIYTGGRITLTPSATSEEFQWIFDETALSRSGNQFTGLTAGTTRVYYGNQDTAAYFDVNVRESELPQTGQDYMLMYAFVGGGVFCIAGVALMAKKRHGRA